jgi:outer membrane protein
MLKNICTVSWLLLLLTSWLHAETYAQYQPEQSASYQTGQSLNLRDIYTLALAHDSTWAAARYANTAAQEKSVQGKALLLPTVNLNSGFNHSETNIQYTGRTVFNNNNATERFDTLSYGINVNQPIYRKQNFVQYRASLLEVNDADLLLLQDRQDLLMKAAQAYFDALLAQDKLVLNQAQKAAIEGQLAQAKANFRNGVSTITDVDEAQARFDVVQSQEIAAGIEIENKKQVLKLLTGQYPGSLSGVRESIPLELPVAQAANTSKTPPLNLWLEEAQQTNLTIQRKKLSYELATKAVELNSAGHLPTLDAVASYNRTDANGGINGFGSDLHNTTVGLQLQIPIYQGGAVSSKVREAVANQQKAQEEIEAARRKVELDTKQAYLEITSSIAQAQANKQTLRSTESALASTNKSFKLGIRTNVDVLNAQQQVFNAKRELLQTHYTYLLGILKLRYSSGLLFEQELDEVSQLLNSSQR